MTYSYPLLKIISKLSTKVPLVSAVGQLANTLKDTPTNNIQTAGELIAIWSALDLYTLSRKGKYKPISIINNYIINPEIQLLLYYTMYLPPLITKPDKLTKNNSSGYLSIRRDDLILGSKYNMHDKDICLDVLNTQNSCKYIINKALLEEYTQPKPEEMSDKDWDNYLKGRELALNHVNKHTHTYFTHKVDKRGRVYVQGYHLNPQGTEYDKALLSFKQEKLKLC